MNTMSLLQMSGTPNNNGKFLTTTGTWGGFKFDLLKPAMAPEDRPYWPAKVTDESGKEVWSFRKDNPSYAGKAVMAEFEGEIFLALVERKDLDMLIPVKDLPNRQRLPDGSIMGGRNIKEMIRVKKVIADLLGLEPAWTQQEGEMRAALVKIANKKRIEEEVAAKREKEEQKLAERRAKDAVRDAILARPRLYVVISEGERAGQKRNGHPVFGNEWECLPSGTFCVEVDSFDTTANKAGKPIESFVVEKKHGAPKKAAVEKVSTKNPVEEKTATMLSQLKSMIITIGDDVLSVFVAPSMDVVKALNAGGTNSGAMLLCPKPGDEKKVLLNELRGGNIKTRELARADVR